MAILTEEIVGKNPGLFIENHFPAIYRENGAELVQLTKDYYKWLETDSKQSVYNSRRMFEYRDVSTTLNKLLEYYQKKFLADLPYNEATIAFVVKNILDLYQRKGTSDGIELFFRLFFNEDVVITYPSEFMLKPSNSSWNTGNYLQLFGNDNTFTSSSGKVYSYIDLISKNITGSVSGAKAAVDAINQVILGNRLTPIVYIDEVQGEFIQYDELITNIDGEVVSFGTINGSLSGFTVDDDYDGTTGNEVGDILDLTAGNGIGGKVIVTGVTSTATGEIRYSIADGGWGYSIDNTRLIVSNQIVFVTNTALDFVLQERLTDQFGNSGIITGQNEAAVFVAMDSGDAFIGNLPPGNNSVIQTVDRTVNITLSWAQISGKNETSPGPMFADTSNPADVKIETLSESEVINVILDPIAPYLGVALNAGDYGAGTPMSGAASPVVYTTTLDQAFDITGITVGKIENFININPGANYTNDVFALAIDSVTSPLSKHDQEILMSVPAEAGSFDIGEIIIETGTGYRGIVRNTNSSLGVVTITPYSYAGFGTSSSIVKLNGDSFNIVTVSRDYSSSISGDNADISTVTSFAIGRITDVSIYNSGYGYVNGTEGELKNSSGEVQARGTIDSTKMGRTSGYWSDFTSHPNGYRTTDAGLEYFDSQQKIQDSDFYQEYSYVIKSKIDPGEYENLFRENVHLAGTKPFSQFLLRTKTGTKIVERFVRYFNDDGQGSIFDQAQLDGITADILNYTVDSTVLTSDNEPTAP